MTDITTILQNPVSLYFLGVIPALFVVGDAPFSTLTSKILHILVCLGCPFTPLFYFLHIKTGVGEGGEVIPDSCAYWLPKDKFQFRVPNRPENNIVNIWPFGYKIKGLDFTNVPNIKTRLMECVTNVSFLDRFACFVSGYFIFVGIIIGIYRVVGPCQQQDWPAIPLLLTWTLPILVLRVLKGKVVVRDPREALKLVEGNIYLERLAEDKTRDIRGKVLATLLISIVVHWMVVVLTYYTKPVGFGCRSIGLAVVAAIWSFNSILCFVYYYLFNHPPPGVDASPVYLWVCTCGVAVGAFFIFFGVISNNSLWWVIMFGNSCDVSSCLDSGSVQS
ncbi:11379_t:CDS:1 [Paraglomus brasilianum]|uniref:11379_t:CDS:1 n=1 Tax=Paraglomus brasilianum TaxID=144538 RepID=A0A9N9FRK2_9GLOM|nr:11379_t:CDS:1 [Paraglomus brasilianum]